MLNSVRTPRGPRIRTGLQPRWKATAACLGVILLGACDGDDSRLMAPITAPARMTEFVTGDAALNLNGAGRFNLQTSGPSTGVPAISAERAGELALANVRTYASFFRSSWEKDRGAPIDVGALQVDPRILYAETPYAVFPEGYHPAYRRSFGPYYLVRLVSGTTPVLLVAVSAYGTDVQIERNGTVSLPAIGGDEFFEHAISASATSGFRPISPEEAVATVGRLTGARTNEVPELVLRGLHHHPATALWKVSLDRAVEVRGASGTRRLATATIYVGPAGRLFIPADAQPRAERGVFRRGPGAKGSAAAPVMADVPIRNGRVAAFEEVLPDEKGR